MDDWPRTQLQQLAPDVDETASKRLFDARRTAGPPERWRFLAAAAAILIVGAGSLVLFGLAGRDEPGDAALEGGQPGSPGEPPLEEPDFDVISRGGSRTPERTLAAADNVDELVELLVDDPVAASLVDFRRQIVVAFSLPRDLCGPELTGFDVDGRTLTPNFAASSDSCPEPTAPIPEPRFRSTWFVAIDRAGLSPSFTLRLPPESANGDGELLLDVTVPAADSVPAQPAFEVLSVQDVGDRAGSLRSAINDAELDALWADAGLDDEVPMVEFQQQVVISFTTYGTGRCGDVFDGFDVEGRVWTPRYAPPLEPGQPCQDVAIPRTYVVAVDRDAAAPGFTLRLLESVAAEYEGEYRLNVDVPPAATLPEQREFEVLSVQDVGDRAGTLRAATDGDQFDALWTDAGLDGEVPDMDFRNRVVISFTIDGSGSCVDEFDGFDVDDQSVWTPRLSNRTTGTCTADAIARTYVVTIDRQAATPAFTLRLSDFPLYEPRGDRRLRVDVPVDE